MYGTVARFQIKPGSDQRLREYAAGPGSEPIAGAVASYVYRLESTPDAYALAVVFEDEAAYRANSASPEQHRRYLALRELLVADPVWEDGEVVFARSSR